MDTIQQHRSFFACHPHGGDAEMRMVVTCCDSLKFQVGRHGNGFERHGKETPKGSMVGRIADPDQTQSRCALNWFHIQCLGTKQRYAKISVCDLDSS